MKYCNPFERDIFNSINFHRFDEFTELITSIFQLNLNARNHYGATFLNFACQYPNVEFIDKLIALGSDIDSINDYKESSLMVASKHGDLHIVQKFLSFQPNVFLKNVDGKTAFDLSIDYHHPKISYILNTYISYIELKQNFDYNKDNILNKKYKI
jgi:ankyrin repeat protein